jgi:hypothetical protein
MVIRGILNEFRDRVHTDIASASASNEVPAEIQLACPKDSPHQVNCGCQLCCSRESLSSDALMIVRDASVRDYKRESTKSPV